MDKFKQYRDQMKNELMDSCLPFWIHNGLDAKNGGIYSCLDRTGKIYSTDKSVWIQGRCVWVFSNMCNTYGKNEQWLGIARSCLDFLNRYCIDKADDRMYFTVTEDGRPLRKRRYFFSETFYILANAEYALATGDMGALNQARKYYDFVLGFYRDPSLDPYKITTKIISSTRQVKAFANPMIMLNVTNVMRRCDPANTLKYDKVSRELIADTFKCFYKGQYKVILENAGPDGEFYENISVGRVVNPGHSLEAAWFLLQEARYFHDDDLMGKVQDIFDGALDIGWDKEYGGILYFVDVFGRPCEQYEHDMKLWWPHNEALITALMLYEDTREKKYLDWFEKIKDYTFNAFPDPQCGEWFGYLRRDGKPTEPPCKGNTFKGPFHLPRMLIILEQILSKL